MRQEKVCHTRRGEQKGAMGGGRGLDSERRGRVRTELPPGTKKEQWGAWLGLGEERTCAH